MERRRQSTLTDVARSAGVSPTTAWKAINGHDRISDETRSRVLEAARQLDYTPNPLARGLLTGRTGTVGMIMRDSKTYRFAIPVMLGAEAALSDIDLSMVTADARGDADRLVELAEMFQRRRVDGIVVVGDNNSVTPALPKRITMPTVYVYGDTNKPRTTIVHTPDDERGGRQVAEHLIGSGRRRLVCLTGPAAARATRERVAGMSAVLADQGVDLVIPVVYGEWSQRWGRLAAQRLVDDGVDFDGVICGSDQIAAGVIDGLSAAGRRIPDDVAVTGYDNWRDFALETDPPQTTVDMELESLGAAGARDLFSIIDGTAVPAGVRLHPCTLVVRGSAPAMPAQRNEARRKVASKRSV